MSQRDAFVQCARSLVGRPYRWGGADPETGLDCSGLVAYCYFQATGKEITRSSYEQFKLGEKAINHEEPGELWFWDTENNGTAGHVAILLGGNKVVHALNPQRGVIISDMYTSMGGPFLGARRIFAPETSTIVEEPAPVEESPRPKARRRLRRRKDKA